MSITPTAEQVQAFVAAPDTGPVVMLNLLKFANHEAEADGSNGEDEYNRYGAAALQLVADRGGRLVWLGKAEQVLIGDPADDWDAVALVQYPSRRAFLEMVTSDSYQAAHTHRERGLARTIILACTETFAATAAAQPS